jgi:purine-cytosine permease-like protein
MNWDAASLAPVPRAERTQPAVDLFLIFAAANVVATTLQTGAVLGARYGSTDAAVVVVGGACFGAALVALLAPVGSRSGVPSMIAARAPLGYRGAQLVSALLYLTNFAWIAINNTIAASVISHVLGGGRERLWIAGLGLLATAVVARGPRAVGHADRLAVPAMLIAGSVLTYAAFTTPVPATHTAPVAPEAPWLWGLDVVIGYQVSWLLMFADYSRYTASPRAASTAVFAGLAVPALWLIPVGWSLAKIAGTDDPGAMLAAANAGWWTAALVTLATVTTNFVNIYLSSLAWRTLSPRSTSARSVWAIGLIGTALGLISSGWLTRFAELMTWLGAILVPVGGVFLAHFVVMRQRVDAATSYRIATLPSFNAPGMIAWIMGFVVYKLAAPIGGTMPALAVSITAYWLLARRRLAAM